MASLIKTYLESLLVYQFLPRPAEFVSRHPHAWLIWEAGPWAAPPMGGAVQATRLPANKALTPQDGDALCFELDWPAITPLVVGRSESLPLIVNDATVSREHIQLKKNPEAWTASPVPGAQPVERGGVPLGESQRLASGDRLVLGHVTLTYLDADAMRERIRLAAVKLQAMPPRG